MLALIALEVKIEIKTNFELTLLHSSSLLLIKIKL